MAKKIFGSKNRSTTESIINNTPPSPRLTWKFLAIANANRWLLTEGREQYPNGCSKEKHAEISKQFLKLMNEKREERLK